MDRVTIEVSGTELELGEIFHRTKAALRTMDLLVEHPAQADRIEAKTPFLRPDIGAEMKLPCRMAIHVAVEDKSHPELG